MSYTKHVWKNEGEAGAITLNKTNLNEMEQGIEDANNLVAIDSSQGTHNEKLFVDNTTNELYYYNGNEYILISSGGGSATGDTLPIGAIIPYPSTTAPTGWLVCDGSFVSKTTYADLYAVIGDSYLDGETPQIGKFRLPNKKGKVSVGYDNNDTAFNSIGKTGGTKTNTIQERNLPWSVPFRHSMETIGQGFTDIEYDLTGWNWYANSSVNPDAPIAMNNLQPYQVDQWIIKATQTAGLVASVVNVPSESTTDTYSCDYINGIDDKFNYSTTEKVVGYNNEGKPVYRVEGTFTISATSSSYVYVNIGMTDKPIDKVYRTDIHNESGTDFSWYDKATIDMYLSTNHRLAFKPTPIDVVGTWNYVVEYTKTTDQAS